MPEHELINGTFLPKKFYPLNLTNKELKRLIEWAYGEQWSREKTINKEFGWGEDSMPINLVAPNVPPEHWSGKGRCVCVMCGYTSTVTNVHRRCTELPADDEAVCPVFCYEHDIPHTVNGKWTMHRSINMVAVS